jgi:hypothetical protein
MMALLTQQWPTGTRRNDRDRTPRCEREHPLRSLPREVS